MSTTFDRNNFHKNTFCVFRATAIPRRKPDFVSRSGSRYWFSDEGVTRHSNHWGRAAKCKWRLVLSEVSSREKTGFAKWNDFMRDNEFERLYFISIQHGIANYFHKDSGDYRGELLRTASETAHEWRARGVALSRNQIFLP
ncbi:MAG: hypothetical protein EOO50_16375 [Flavobacterium sp.]|nr:MAG: hypothetical protein EOO50_16375 [Flavobacterium sp.]